jgi:small subunit ribosomal protein S20
VANIRSAEKRMRQSERRRLRNREVRARVRSAVRAAREGLEQKAPAAGESLRAAIRLLDKAVTKGVIHRNTAARKKSALARRLARLSH